MATSTQYDYVNKFRLHLIISLACIGVLWLGSELPIFVRQLCLGFLFGSLLVALWKCGLPKDSDIMHWIAVIFLYVILLSPVIITFIIFNATTQIVGFGIFGYIIGAAATWKLSLPFINVHFNNS